MWGGSPWADLPWADGPAAAAGGGTTVAVPAGALTLAAFAPSVTATAHQTIAVPAGALTLTAFAPTVTAAANQTVAVPAGSLSLTAFAPTVTATANQSISVPAGALLLTGYAPIVTADAGQTIQVPAGALSLAAYAPSVTASTNYVSVPAGSLTLTAYFPSVSNGEVVAAARRVYKLDEQPQLGNDPNRMRIVLSEHIRNHAREINRLKAGYFSPKLNTATAAPTAPGSSGDFVPNEVQTELGTAGSKYVLEGWSCLSNGTWVEKRFLTGN